ncbi:choice-of-anchor K domain-containing protein [Luteolibacter sp. SL250]|uniref:choice-of-anchor K domain-containing protein n=1 Tax=Luteolibacter sp. SL250 TaxID=2995170 RepID=UPI00226F842B|nr:choice-of-anchor K domain-containing protein [Luteolibacter sp. SL250]WAC18162.1 choice-of-anchor K domain-containing protein [Luteolibacter sp. SL250]
MSPTRFLFICVGVIALVTSVREAKGQTISGNPSFLVSGRFTNPVEEGSNSLLVRDNNLSNGYNSGADTTDAPSGIATTGPAGAAFFQWGRASTSDTYAHPSALWFIPVDVTNAAPGKDFQIGYLYYRNGTIQSSTGASSVDMAFTFTFPSDGGTMNTSFTSNLVNTPNNGTAEQNADVVSLSNHFSPTGYKDSSGNAYYLELSFKMDADTLNTLSTGTEFRAYEGGTSRAEIIGRFTTTPNVAMVPEPSTLLIGLLGALPLISRRKR